MLHFLSLNTHGPLASCEVRFGWNGKKGCGLLFWGCAASYQPRKMLIPVPRGICISSPSLCRLKNRSTSQAQMSLSRANKTSIMHTTMAARMHTEHKRMPKWSSSVVASEKCKCTMQKKWIHRGLGAAAAFGAIDWWCTYAALGIRFHAYIVFRWSV